MASDAITKLSKSELGERYERAKNALKRFRDKNEDIGLRVTNLTLSGAGGFAAGVIDHRIPEVAGLPTSGVVGFALGVLGAVDGAGKASEQVMALGSGMLAGALHGQGQKFSQGLNI